ncbi:TPA: hypothetical protein ACLFL9_002203 [Salmonella enterica subsp. diarizonae serovar 53:z10:z35]
MNYAGNEEVRKGLEKLTEALYEVYRQAAEFESRYKWNKATPVDPLPLPLVFQPHHRRL